MAETEPGAGRSHRSSSDVELPQVGDLVGGKHRLMRVLGEGGMSSVWIAHNQALDIDVAVKFIRADLADGTGAPLADRLLREARAVARLGHPAIVRVTDYGETKGRIPYLVMELLEGEPLSVALAHRGQVEASLAVQILLPIAHALTAAHARNIVHRDVKPENVFLAQTPGGGLQPKLIDFGIVKTDKRDAVRLTTAGEMVGTPGYMSPEQARGEDVDFRADLWGFCVILYELVTGRLPFEGANHNALMRAIIEDPAPPLTSFSVGDEALWAIVERGLRKDPAERWQSMRELGTALARWLLAAGVSQDVAGAALEATWTAARPQPDGPDLLSLPEAPTKGSEPISGELAMAPSSIPSPDERKQPKRLVGPATADAVSIDGPAARRPRSARRRWMVGAAGLAVVVVGGLAIWKLALSPSTAAPDGAALPSAPGISGAAASATPDEGSTNAADPGASPSDAAATAPDASDSASAGPTASARAAPRVWRRRDRPPPEVRKQPAF